MKPEGKLNLSCKIQGMEQTCECSPRYDNYGTDRHRGLTHDF